MTSQYIDTAGSVRAGETLPVEPVHQWLQQRVNGLAGLPAITQYSGGASNWTYCLSYPDAEFILRRAPAGTKAKGAHDMGREFRLQQALKPVYDYVPAMVGYCDDENLIGSDFYVMEKITGVIPRKHFPRGLDVSKAQCQQLCKNMFDSLIALHSVDYKQAGLDHLGKGEGYTERQISGWRTRYQKAKTWNVPSGKKVINWLERNLPSKENICLTHNDFRLDNLVLDPDDITHINAVLDWELATLGDPLMDLGNTLAYWVEPGDDFMAQMTRRQPTHLPGMMSRNEIVDYYLSNMSLDVDDFRFYEVYGMFRLAAIAQQIYYRYHHKQTRNTAFKRFWLFVHYLLWRCERAIKGR